MEKIFIRIPNFNKFEELVARLDWCQSYSKLLKKHVKEPKTIMGMETPIHILKDMVDDHRKFIFDSQEQRVFVDCLKDMCYIVSTLDKALPAKETPPEPPKPQQQHQQQAKRSASTVSCHKSMTKDMVKEAEMVMINIRKQVNQHMKSHKQVTKQYKVMLDNLKAKNNIPLTEESESGENLDATSGVSNALEELVLDIIDNPNKNSSTPIAKFKQALEKEHKDSKILRQLSKGFEESVTNTITEEIGTSVRYLCKVWKVVSKLRDLSNFQDSYNQLQAINSKKIATDLLSLCSKTYVYYDPEKYIKETKAPAKIPASYIEDSAQTQNDISFSMSSPCLVNNNLISPAKEPADRQSQEGQFVHQKILLVKGSVSFGWVKRPGSGHKSWGFFQSCNDQATTS